MDIDRFLNLLSHPSLLGQPAKNDGLSKVYLYISTYILSEQFSGLSR